MVLNPKDGDKGKSIEVIAEELEETAEAIEEIMKELV